MGGSSLGRKSLTFFHVHSVARICGLENLLVLLTPGAYAPGFMLPPASQAKPHFLCKALAGFKISRLVLL